MHIAKTLQRWHAGFTNWQARIGAFAALGVAALLAAAPAAQAQIRNGGFEDNSFNHWTLRDYRRPNVLPGTAPFSAPTTFAGLNLVYNNNTLANGAANQNGTYRSEVLTLPGVAANTNNIVRYPFSGGASARLGNNGSQGATVLEQTATMALADVDPVDGKVHIRFALAPVLYDAGHTAWEQPFFFVEVINVTKGNVQLFNTFNFANQAGIPWTKVGNYRSTNWQGFDIAPGNGQLDPGDQVLLRVVVANCEPSAAGHTAQVYMDVFGSKMPGLSVAATGPSTTLPGAQVTYTYNYTNNSGVYALDAWVRLAAPVTVDGKYLTFVPGSYPNTCTGIHAGISPRADYIDCPVGDLIAGAGGSFPVTFTVPNDAATTGPNNVINNGDYDIRASTVSPFIGPLVKTTITTGTTLVDLGITIGNGGVPSYAVGGAVTYTVEVTNHGPVDVAGAIIKQTALTGVTNAAAATWACAAPGTATCVAANGTGMLDTLGNLPVGQKLVYTITTLSAQAAGTPVATVATVATPAGMTDSVAANNSAGLSTPVSAAQYTLTVNTAGAGMGGVNAVPVASACASAAVPTAGCSVQSLGENEDAYLTAVAAAGTIFKGWTGQCTTITGSECHVNMGAANKNVTANFALAWLVTPTVIGGTWSGNPLVEDGLTGTITITPGPGIAGAPVVTSDTCRAINVPVVGPDGSGNYTFTTDAMTQDCAFTVEFPSPQLTLTKSGPASATVGAAYSYTILVENSGAVATTATSTVTDMVPAGLTINSAPGCTVVSPLVTCTVAAGLAAGSSQSFTINVTPTVAAIGTVNNTATASGGGDTACPVVNPCRSNTVPTTIANLPDLSIAKTASVVSTVVGVAYNYTITISNSGAPTTAPATVSDDVPAGLVINSATGGAGCTITLQHVECTVAAGLTSATPVAFTINVTPMAAAGASVTNTARVSGGGDPTCPALTPCDSTPVTTTLVAQNPVLDLVKTAGAPSGDWAGDTIDYSFTLTNSGNVALSSVALNDPLLGGAVACPATTLAVGASMTCGPVTYTITQDDVDATMVQNTATATGTPPRSVVGVPPTPVTGTSSTNTPLAHHLDQELTKVVTADSTGGDAALGDVLTYTVRLTNKSNATLSTMSVSDAMITPGSITCASVAPGATCELVGTYTVTQADVAAGMVRNTALVTGPMCPAGSAGSQCTTTITTPVVSIDAIDDAVTTKAERPVTTPVLGNDTHVGGVIDPRSVVMKTPSPNGTLSVDPATGAITFIPTPGFTGTTTYTYQVCLAAPNGTVCDIATVTVTVVPLEIKAEDDPLPPTEGGPAGNVFDNDTLEGNPVDPAKITTTVTTPATPINGGKVPTLDPVTGEVSVPPGTPAGEYRIEYRICEVLYPDNCDDATVTVTVTAPRIEAIDDASDPFSVDGGGSTPSVLGNDTLGGKPIQPGQVTLVPGTPSHPGLKMNPDGTIRINMLIPPGTYTYPYTICEVLNPTNCASAIATVVVTGQVQLRVVKTAGVREVHLGDLVRYTLTVQNTGNAALVGGNVVDTAPAGLSYVEGSLLVEDGDNAGTVSGQRPLRFGGVDVPAGGQAKLVYLMRVSAGARAGVLVNQAQAMSPDNEPLSNVATAEVTLSADALLDDSLVFGTVFNDRDGDGWQDSAALSGVRAQGGFAPGAYVAGSTTVDRGAGMHAEADASAPLLHGIAMGAIAGRQSEADPVARYQKVIRQHLRALDFTDDFVLTSDQGVTVRMDRNGVTTIEKNGEAAKGLNAAAPTVERRIAQGENGYVVDYVIGNAGIDERGIPGVRIASVEGLLIETDQFGRYHLAGMSGGAWERGRNFILKVDPATLPTGATFSTDNPLLRRLTPGVPVRFDWGVTLPEQVIGGSQRQVELEMGEVFFAPGSAEVQARYQPVVEAMAAKVREHPGAEVVIQADGEREALAFERAEAVKVALLTKLDAAAAKGVVVSARAKVEDATSLVAGVTADGVLLGTVLFDTDTSAIKPGFGPLLDKIAAALTQMGGGSISIVGHTDVRGSNAYNTALGMRRAKAVFDALAERLDAGTRGRLRVDIANDPAAPVGVRK